jgi:hypothetical protein
MIDMEDPLRLFEQAERLQKDSVAVEEGFARLTRKLFTTSNGRDWLRLALARSNFMGSVFSAEDGMSPHMAAYRDGIRSVFSDILNCAATAAPPTHPTHDESA